MNLLVIYGFALTRLWLAGMSWPAHLIANAYGLPGYFELRMEESPA